MKKLILIISSLTILVFFSGCGATGTYQPEFIAKEVNPYYSKVMKENVVIFPNDITQLSKSPDSVRGKLSSLNLDVGTMNNNIAKEFFGQYFTNVSFSKIDNNGLFIKSKILDYKYSYGGVSDSTEMTINLQIEVYYHNKLLINKTYKKTADNSIILTFSSLTLKDGAIELFHKLLLSIYEEDFKKDLLEAL